MLTGIAILILATFAAVLINDNSSLGKELTDSEV